MWWNRYIHIPFQEKGRTIEGTDCWGMVRLVYQLERGLKLPSYSSYYRNTNEKQILSDLVSLESKSKWSETLLPREFDVVVLRVGGMPMHVGLVTKPNHVLHCSRDIGTVHERLDSLRWKNKVAGYFRYE